MTKTDHIATALRDVFISSNICDRNFEPANIVDVLYRMVRVLEHGLDRLGNTDATTPMGALEAHSKAILNAAERIALAIETLAEAARSTPHEPRTDRGA